MDPEDIINQYHKKKEAMPKLCKKCGKGEMKNTGVRTSASVNYVVWKCKNCSNEELEFAGLDENANSVIEKQSDS